MDRCSCTPDNPCPIALELIEEEGKRYKFLTTTKPFNKNLYTEYEYIANKRRVHRTEALEVYR